MKRIRFTADLFIGDANEFPRDVDRALYWGEKHQDHHFDVVSIEEIEELPDEEDE